jgi:hypothetical protein
MSRKNRTPAADTEERLATALLDTAATPEAPATEDVILTADGNAHRWYAHAEFPTRAMYDLAVADGVKLGIVTLTTTGKHIGRADGMGPYAIYIMAQHLGYTLPEPAVKARKVVESRAERTVANTMADLDTNPAFASLDPALKALLASSLKANVARETATRKVRKASPVEITVPATNGTGKLP